MPPVRYVEPQSSSLEILLGAQKLHILGHVEKELDDFCSTRKSPEARNQCQEVRPRDRGNVRAVGKVAY